MTGVSVVVLLLLLLLFPFAAMVRILIAMSVYYICTARVKTLSPAMKRLKIKEEEV